MDAKLYEADMPVISNFTVSSIRSSGIKISCDFSSAHGFVPVIVTKHCHVTIYTDENNAKPLHCCFNEDQKSTEKTWWIGFQPYTNYVIKMKFSVQNNPYCSEEIERHIRTKPTIPSAAPMLLKSGYSQNHITNQNVLYWQKIPKSSENGPELQYVLYKFPANIMNTEPFKFLPALSSVNMLNSTNNLNLSAFILLSVNGTKSSAILEKPTKNGDHIMIRSKNSEGLSLNYTIINISSPVIPQVEYVYVKTLNNNHYKITFTSSIESSFIVHLYWCYGTHWSLGWTECQSDIWNATMPSTALDASKPSYSFIKSFPYLWRETSKSTSFMNLPSYVTSKSAMASSSPTKTRSTTSELSTPTITSVTSESGLTEQELGPDIIPNTSNFTNFVGCVTRLSAKVKKSISSTPRVITQLQNSKNEFCNHCHIQFGISIQKGFSVSPIVWNMTEQPPDTGSSKSSVLVIVSVLVSVMFLIVTCIICFSKRTTFKTTFLRWPVIRVPKIQIEPVDLECISNRMSTNSTETDSGRGSSEDVNSSTTPKSSSLSTVLTTSINSSFAPSTSTSTSSNRIIVSKSANIITSPLLSTKKLFIKPSSEDFDEYTTIDVNNDNTLDDTEDSQFNEDLTSSSAEFLDSDITENHSPEVLTCIGDYPDY